MELFRLLERRTGQVEGDVHARRSCDLQAFYS